jgi:hypothetical protein
MQYLLHFTILCAVVGYLAGRVNTKHSVYVQNLLTKLKKCSCFVSNNLNKSSYVCMRESLNLYLSSLDTYCTLYD